MRIRLAYLFLIVVGCQSMHSGGSAPLQLVAKPTEFPQQHVSVVRATANEPPPREPEPDPEPDDPLTLAGRCIARDDVRGAVTHLDVYVRKHPEQPLYRFQLAELYVRSDQSARARFHYEEFAKRAQDAPALRPQRVTAHTRLMEMAQHSGDRFSERFHRGVGLLLIVEQMDALKEKDDSFCEEMLCKSLQALREAKELKPTEPRVRAHLADIYARLGNAHAARVERAAARATAAAGELTPTEAGPLLP